MVDWWIIIKLIDDERQQYASKKDEILLLGTIWKEYILGSKRRGEKYTAVVWRFTVGRGWRRKNELKHPGGVVVEKGREVRTG